MENQKKPIAADLKIVSRPSNEEIEEDLTTPLERWKIYPTATQTHENVTQTAPQDNERTKGEADE